MYQIGGTVYVTNGSWTFSPTSFTYQWQNSPDLVTWSNIVGKNNSSYVIQQSDENKYIRCVVTASNAFDSASQATPYIGPILYLGFVCQLSTANPNAATQTWSDITPYVRAFHITRARQRTLQRFEAGTMDITLENRDRRFDPTFAQSPYYPNLLPLRQIRFGFVLDGVIYWEFTGYVERWPQVYQGPTYADVELTCVDGFELVSNHYLSSVFASFTTTFGSNKDLTFTSVVLGYVGNSTTIQYVVAGLNTALSVSVSGTNVTVNVATDGAGAATSTANQVLAAVNASVPAEALLTSSLAPGSTGTGVVSALAQTPLSGGTFNQQTTGAYINQIFQFISWSGATNITTGNSQVQAQTISNDGSTHALDQIYAAADTEAGQFFFDVQNRPTFLDRATLASSSYLTSMMSLTDLPNNSTTFGYKNVKPSLDKDLIFNDVRVTRLNGTEQTASDSTSDTKYFTRTLSVGGVLNTTDASALDLADALLLKFKQPILRFDPITLSPGDNHAFWQKLVNLELIDQVTITRTPPGGPQVISADVALIGIEIQGQAGPVTSVQWTLSVDPTNTSNFFILNDAIFGILDSNFLGY